MRGRLALVAGFATLLSTLVTSLASAVSVPSQFVVEDVAPGAGFVVPVGIAFLPGGRMLVAEKRGQVYAVKNGIKNATPLWDRTAEVLDNGDRGLLGIAVDPRYNGTTNRWIYLMYTVDPDSNNVETNDDAFGRLIRIQISATDSNVVDYSTRQVLFGADWRRGPVSGSTSHTIGALRFATDGSLMVSVGDGGQFNAMDPGGLDPNAFGATRTDPAEDIGAFRAQMRGSLAGKILRLNPDTGLGYPSNPYWTGDGSAAQSKVWSYGLRNPYRFCLRPGTGSTDPAAGNPGTLYIGDVGWTAWEELDVEKGAGGRNFGWPCYEGIGANSSYQAASPASFGCGTIGTPANPAVQSPPLSTWHHSTDGISVPPGFHGNTSIGGAFYRSNLYPTQYRNQCFFGDYGQNWIKVAVVDGNDNLSQVLPFGTAMDGPVDFNVDPLTGDILYVAINVGQVRRIRYTGATGGNTPPVANLTATPTSGPAPLAVNFSSAGSSDADGDPLTFAWSFGDGTPGQGGASASHTYANPGTYTAQLTVTDGRGGQDTKGVTITAGGGTATFPTTPVLDNFNRANGALGASWTGLTTGLTVNTNAMASTGAPASPVWNGAVFGPDQEVYVTLSAITLAAPEHDLMLKVQGTSYTAGHIEVRWTSPRNEVQVSTYTAATQWVNRGAPISVAFVPGDRFGARALADGTIEVYRNATKIGTADAGDWPYKTLGGRLGMTFDQTTASRMDDFGGGDVVFNSNTKPTATIVTPANNSFFVTGQAIALTGTGSDAQTPSNQLGYQWIVDLYHNTHVHPSVFTATGASASFTAENHDDGTGVWEQVKFVVTDAGGLTDTAKVNIYPEIDLTPGPVAVSPPTPTAGQSAQFSFKLYNRGRMPAPISRWALRAGGTLIAQGDTLVAANDSVTIVRSFAGLVAGTSNLRAVGDSLAAVVETSEANNASNQPLTVNPAPGNRAPVANAAGAPLTGTAPLTVNFSSAGSSDPDGDPITFAWAFGDGGTSTAANPPHAYTSAGSYRAILTVSDNRGGSARDTVDVAVSPPPSSGFPATAVLDDFNRANGPIGSPWENSVGMNVASNQFQTNRATTSTTWNGAIFGANQEAYLRIATPGAGAVENILMLKVQGQFWHNGHIEVDYLPAEARVSVNTYSPSTGWAGHGSTPATFAAGDQFGARALASGTVVVYKNGAAIGTFAVAPYAALGGRIGIETTASQASRFDDFGGGDAPATPAPAAGETPRAEAPANDAFGRPAVLALSAPRPNPAVGAMAMALDLPEPAEVGFAVLDLQGRVVWSEPARTMGAGRWTLRWDGRAAGGPAHPGVYLARVMVAGRPLVRRFALLQ